jgi:hypothetical protein
MRVAPAVTVHLAGRHLGTSDGVAWPMTLAAGASWVLPDTWLLGGRLAASGSAEWSHETGPGGAAAVEYGLSWNGMEAALRAGERVTLARSASVIPSGGLLLRVARVALEIGVMPFGQLGTAQVVSLSYAQEPPAANR